MYTFIKVVMALIVASNANLVLSDSDFNTKVKTDINKQQIETALQLVNAAEPEFQTSAPAPTAQQIADMGFAQPNVAEALNVTASDGEMLHVNYYSQDSSLSVLLLHGVASSSYTYNIMAGKLRDSLNASIYALDFRGHGLSGGTKGDVDFRNQYAHDIEDALQFMKRRAPANKILIAGHSMGGGISLIHAMLDQKSRVDGYIFFAPNLGVNAPTMKAPAENADNDAFLKLHISRMIGLHQLNQMGIKDYDHLPVMFINMPSEFGTNRYSYRAMLSTSPEDYSQALKKITVPSIPLVGSDDEAFDANGFKQAMTGAEKAVVHIIAHETHNGIRHSEMAMKQIQQWANKHQLTRTAQ
jgi:alpha-beta hydrolase superfamily lysophospholipase